MKQLKSILMLLAFASSLGAVVFLGVRDPALVPTDGRYC